jgi:DNA-binding NarL/FixJ family response regulator
VIQTHADHWDIPPPVYLKDQELKLIHAIAQGRTIKEIAEAYHMSVRTAETQRKRLLEKTHTSNTAGLLAY